MTSNLWPRFISCSYYIFRVSSQEGSAYSNHPGILAHGGSSWIHVSNVSLPGKGIWHIAHSLYTRNGLASHISQAKACLGGWPFQLTWMLNTLFIIRTYQNGIHTFKRPQERKDKQKRLF